jgi:serine protease Do
MFDLGSGALVGIVEGYRTARLTLPESQGRSLDLPVGGETTVVSVQSVMRFLTASGLSHLVSGRRLSAGHAARDVSGGIGGGATG